MIACIDPVVGLLYRPLWLIGLGKADLAFLDQAFEAGAGKTAILGRDDRVEAFATFMLFDFEVQDFIY